MKPRNIRGRSASRTNARGAKAKAAPKADAPTAAVFYPRVPVDRPRTPQGSGSVVHYPR